MDSKFIVLLLAGVIATGLLYSHPAYAHNFGGDQSASFLAKVQELKAEMAGIEQDLPSQNDVAWHVDKSGEYWNANDAKEMGERNTLLAKEIPDTLSAIYDAVNTTNPDTHDIKQKIDTLNGYLDEGITARVDKDKMQNSTVQVLVVTSMISETLEHYADAIGTNTDLNDMNAMNMTNSSSMSGMHSGTMSMTTIVNNAAYHSAQILAKSSQDYFDNFAKPIAPASSSQQISVIDTQLANLNDEINSKADPNDIMITVHTKIHPALIMAFGLTEHPSSEGSVVPEFPLPILLAIISIAGVVAVFRLKPRLGF